MGRYLPDPHGPFYDRLCGVISMMAAIFTVTWMQKNNELLAMLAAGISTQRVIRPVSGSRPCSSAAWRWPTRNSSCRPVRRGAQKSHDDDGLRKVMVASRYDINGILIHGKDGDRASRTIIPFNASLPAAVYDTPVEINAKQGRYFPEDDLKSPLRGGWLLRAPRSPPISTAGLVERSSRMPDAPCRSRYRPTAGRCRDWYG